MVIFFFFKFQIIAPSSKWPQDSIRQYVVMVNMSVNRMDSLKFQLLYLLATS